MKIDKHREPGATGDNRQVELVAHPTQTNIHLENLSLQKLHKSIAFSSPTHEPSSHRVIESSSVGARRQRRQPVNYFVSGMFKVMFSICFVYTSYYYNCLLDYLLVCGARVREVFKTSTDLLPASVNHGSPTGQWAFKRLTSVQQRPILGQE